jgi:serine protease Do
MNYDNNFNDNYENENRENNINNDSLSKEYGEINFIMNEPVKKPRRRKSFLSYIALALVAAIIGGLAGSFITSYKLDAFVQEEGAKSSINAQEVNINLTDDVYFAVAVAEKAQKTVVGITTETERQVNTFWGPQMRVSSPCRRDY